MKNGSVGFSFFSPKYRSVSVGFENENGKKAETETERFSVGFSVVFSVKPAKKSTCQRIQCACVGDDRIVWCQEETKSYINQVGGTRLY